MMKRSLHWHCGTRRGLRRRAAWAAGFFGCALLAAGGEPARETHSNGLGGGRWSDPASWHDGRVPSASDHVVISTGDEIRFDAGIRNEPNCAALSIDPRGVLGFRLDDKPHRLTVAGPVKSYGILRVDASDAPRSRATLRLAAEREDDRVLRLRRGSALLLYGPETGDPDRHGLAIEAAEPTGAAATGLIEASGKVMLDLSRVALRGIRLQISEIDNTGFDPAQRLNLTANAFLDGAGLSLRSCDTAKIHQNRFIDTPETPPKATAVRLEGNSLTSFRENLIRGYAVGLEAVREVDAAVGDNRISDSGTGMILRQVQNVMIRGNHLTDCSTGVLADRSSGVIDTLSVRGAALGIDLHRSTLQLSNLNIRDRPEEAVPLRLIQASATLLNANIAPDEIRMEGNRPNDEFWVRKMEYLVLKVTGKVPEKAVVQIRTAEVSGGAPEGRADLNVRNSPARLSPEGWTPFPRSLRPLVLRSWWIDAEKRVRDAPFYDLSILPVLDRAEETPGPLYQQVLEPSDDWFRPDPNERKPTLEVNIP